MLDAAGFDTVIVETVGAGQSEVEIARLADTRIVVCPPGLGDDVQAIKAGILEIADLLVVSKGDLPAAEATVRDLEDMLAPARAGAAPVQVLKTAATRGDGIAAVVDAVLAHAAAAGRGRRFRAGATPPIDEVAAVDRAITTRRSVRRFLPTPVPRATVEDILAVASRAPSGTNTQPWHVHVLAGERAAGAVGRGPARAPTTSRTRTPRSIATTRTNGTSPTSGDGAGSAGTCTDCSASTAPTRRRCTASTGAITASSTRRSA